MDMWLLEQTQTVPWTIELIFVNPQGYESGLLLGLGLTIHVSLISNNEIYLHFM